MKSILVTGSSSGIGYAICKKFAEEGWSVFGTVRNSVDAQKLRDILGANFCPLIVDVTNAESIQNAFTKLSSLLEGKGLNILVNNAGICISGPIEEVNIDEVSKLFNVNVFGAISVIQKFMPLLRLEAGKENKDRPAIINIGSILGLISIPYTGIYSASKFALRSVADGLRLEINGMGIDISTIAFGQIETPIWDKSLKELSTTDTANYNYFRENKTTVINQLKKSSFNAKYAADKIYAIARKTKRKYNYIYTKDTLLFKMLLLLPFSTRHKILLWKMKDILSG